MAICRYRSPTGARDAGGHRAGAVRAGWLQASFGRYQVDARARTFTFRVECALVRSLVGKELPRRFELSGGQLVITSTDPKERWKAVWAKEPEGKDAR